MSSPSKRTARRSPTSRRTLLALLATILAAHAAPRTSEHYAISADTIDFGGQRVASAHYTADGSVGPIVGVSTEAGTATIAKNGFIGQLYDILGYGLVASDYYPAELGTTQIFPVASLDDGTSLVLPAGDFTFSVLGGPLASISAEGIVTAGEVYENTAAMVGAVSPAFAGQFELPLYVQDTVTDNFGSYAGDALADAWQVQHFGTNNPLAAPGLDPDGDGQKNLFEFTAGLVPTDPASVFRLRIESVPGQPAHKRLVFSPVLADRTYTVKARTSLTNGSPQLLEDEASDDQLPERRVTDQSAAGARKFYEVEITQP